MALRILVFTSDNCAPCKAMKDTGVIDILKEYGEVVEVNAHSDTGADYANQLNVATVPTTIFFNSNGNEVLRLFGYTKSKDLRLELDKLTDFA